MPALFGSRISCYRGAFLMLAAWWVQGLNLLLFGNFPSVSVMQAVESVMADKYSEEYPSVIYYGGN